MCYSDLCNAHLLIFDCALKHGLTAEQIEHAWRNAVDFKMTGVSGGQAVFAAIGPDQHNRMLEITAHSKPYGIVVYHANTPPTNRAIRQFRLI